ncbi:TadA family conjugal transfer-associated ATPase [Schumannella soli]|uniref:TadA family conjugal transfer-associated ATPase n=1 Tax=Schumannella soli TaxID=2590779 RepID=A0A506YA37_9MICO|nr:TadA family conjugal transfer-associated ATPase [Schumannella soli]TPW77319.1 TadA family conjugal transfer-associated ATPase [Schumannella soli]
MRDAPPLLPAEPSVRHDAVPVLPFVARPGADPPSAAVATTASRTADVRVPALAASPRLASAAGRDDLSEIDFGPLSPLVADPRATDVFLTADGALWVDRGVGLEPDGDARLTSTQARELAVRLIAAGGRHVDEATPCMDVRLGDGVRVHAVLPPVSPGGPVLSIRLPRRSPPGFPDLCENGFFARDGDAERVRELVLARRNILVTGAGGSGKTTLLGALLALAPPTERIVVIEDVGELRIAHPHVVALEARQANLEGRGGIGLDRLVREALRMRPDRLVVGECRGAELRELLSALNTGHDGGAGTLHANSLADVPSRLEALAATVGLGAEALARQAVSAIDAVLHLERREGRRRLVAIGRPLLDQRGRLAVEST